MAQGAAQATEDAAALKAALARHDELGEALKAYESVRLPRAAYVARNTRVLQEWLHLYDGQARDQRDSMMKQDAETNPIFWAYKARKDWLFGYDALQLDVGLDIPALPPMPPREASVYRAVA